MKKTRKAFAWIEILLVLVIVGLLATVFVPATLKIKDEAREKIIMANLSEFAMKGQKYMNEKDLKNVDYKTLVDAKIIEAFEPVAGEKYDDMQVLKEGGVLRVKTANGNEISKAY